MKESTVTYPYQPSMDQIAGALSLALAKSAYCPQPPNPYCPPPGGFNPFAPPFAPPPNTPYAPPTTAGNGAGMMPHQAQMAAWQAAAMQQQGWGGGGGMGWGFGYPNPGPFSCPPWGGGKCSPCAPQTRADLTELARGEDQPFGLDTGAIDVPSGATATISTSPQKPCIPNRVTVGDSVSDNFACSAISVGVEPVLITVGNMSMAIFKSAATAPAFRSVPLVPGVDFSMTVTNISQNDLRYLATVMAKAMPSYYT